MEFFKNESFDFMVGTTATLAMEGEAKILFTFNGKEVDWELVE